MKMRGVEKNQHTHTSAEAGESGEREDENSNMSEQQVRAVQACL